MIYRLTEQQLLLKEQIIADETAKNGETYWKAVKPDV